MKQPSRSPRLGSFVALPLVVCAVVTGTACSGDANLPEFLVTETIWIDLQDFVVAVRAGHVEDIVVDGSEISFRYYDTPRDSPNYKTKMDPGDTLEQVLLDAGFRREEFPAFGVK